MCKQTIHLTQGDHNAALVACQHPAATEDDKAFLGYVASLYVICERISRDDYHRLQAILRRLDGAQADALQPTTTPAPVEAGASLTPAGSVHAIRADVPPLGETYGYGAKVAVLATGELVTLSIEFCKNEKARAILTRDQAKMLAALLDEAIGKAALTILERQQSGIGGKP
jgi:hypothetical protein